MRREQDVERLCSSFGAALRYIGSHAPRENNQPMVSRDWAEQHIHECIVGSACRFCPALNLGLRAISLTLEICEGRAWSQKKATKLWWPKSEGWKVPRPSLEGAAYNSTQDRSQRL